MNEELNNTFIQMIEAANKQRQQWQQREQKREEFRNWFLIGVVVLIVQIGIEHPDIVTKQAILETGHFECKSCSLDRNNIFGFRWKGQYLKFNHWRRSVYYYLHWQRRKYTGGDYYDFLDSVGYATGSNYIWKLKHTKFDGL